MKNIVNNHKDNNNIGAYSVCSAHPLVIEATFSYELENDTPVVIEATSNQVNQFGGYTGMKPIDFVSYVYEIASKVGFPKERIILGGDHLGPNCWQNENANEAMDKSKELIKQYVEAGFTKIHLDASMSCADDKAPLDPSVVAKRAAELCAVAEKYAAEENRDKLTYIIGTEVPVPGGEASQINTVHVTKLNDVRETIDTHVTAFEALGVGSAIDKVVGVVVQPGVEFDHSNVIRYNKSEAEEISKYIEGTPWIYEAHSTDYQTPAHLKELVQTHFSILKVGPALTFALREALFALAEIETCLMKTEMNSQFKQVVDSVLLDTPKYWKSYYGEKHSDIINNLHFSFSDRIRYYWTDERIQAAQQRLIDNLNQVDIPLAMLSQFMPTQYLKVSKGVLSNEPESLIIDKIQEIIEQYSLACK
ncbi:tagatose-bisphosphate aldolase subunit GatZ [Vibrio parahaemolyticus]|uniref:tagatose-bisphosphate aldolase subunit GatZ n=1 Tax=Vibrio parahaemolyticus TaxID=670 RepID=UPI0028F45D9D|nr:tagatose-bisphosphate aldolase subunit GatZ [Vibrio parahaemolyticus]WMP07293.1 tagatose-bisphosphate aldolase subunit GatZ [Vibrio parahaemolyticus]